MKDGAARRRPGPPAVGSVRGLLSRHSRVITPPQRRVLLRRPGRTPRHWHCRVPSSSPSVLGQQPAAECGCRIPVSARPGDNRPWRGCRCPPALPRGRETLSLRPESSVKGERRAWGGADCVDRAAGAGPPASARPCCRLDPAAAAPGSGTWRRELFGTGWTAAWSGEPTLAFEFERRHLSSIFRK